MIKLFPKRVIKDDLSGQLWVLINFSNLTSQWFKAKRIFPFIFWVDYKPGNITWIYSNNIKDYEAND